MHEATWQQPSISLPLFHWVQCTEFASAPYFAIKCQIHLSSLDTSTPKVADYKKIFDKFDVDSGGTIDAQELGTLIRGLGWENLDSVLTKFNLSFSKPFHDF